MKTLTNILALLVLSAGIAAAQDVTGFKAPQNPGSTQSIKSPPNPNVVLKPKLGGVFIDGGKNGWVMVSPAAPAEYGMGEKYLAAPSSREDLQHESTRAAHHDAERHQASDLRILRRRVSLRPDPFYSGTSRRLSPPRKNMLAHGCASGMLTGSLNQRSYSCLPLFVQVESSTK